MTPTFKKLNLKEGQSIVVLNAPKSFELELAGLTGFEVARDLQEGGQLTFGIAFAVSNAERDRVSRVFASAAQGDAVIWVAYPKGSSKRYECEFNRDTGWCVFAGAGFEAVRQVAIDEDWSALRFRRVQFIKTFSRSPERAATAIGKARTAR